MNKRTSYVAKSMIENKNVPIERLQEGRQGMNRETPKPPQVKLTLLPLLLDIEQAMEVLSLGKTKIYELIETDGLPVLHIGKAVRFSYKALEQWIEQRMQDVA